MRRPHRTALSFDGAERPVRAGVAEAFTDRDAELSCYLSDLDAFGQLRLTARKVVGRNPLDDGINIAGFVEADRLQYSESRLGGLAVPCVLITLAPALVGKEARQF